MDAADEATIRATVNLESSNRFLVNQEIDKTFKKFVKGLGLQAKYDPVKAKANDGELTDNDFYSSYSVQLK